MNTRVFTSWLLIICPIAMMVVFIVLEPLVIGEIDESLAVRERALATLETFSDNEVPGYFVNILGVVFMLGTISGLALLGKSLDGNGAALGTVSSLIFTAVLAIPVIALGLSLSAGEIFAEGYTDTAVSVELMAESTFMGFPIFLGLGYILLGLGLLLEKGTLPIALTGLLLLAGVVMLPGILLDPGFGFLVFAISMLVVVASGVFLLRRSD